MVFANDGERAWIQGTDAQREQLVRAFKRNPIGSPARWNALGEVLRDMGLSDSASNRSDLAREVETYGMR